MKPLVPLSGPDGSGKTTLALYLKEMFEQKGYNVKLVRIRGTHTLAFLLVIFLKRVLKLHGNNLHYYHVHIPSKLNKLWLFIELISVIPLIIYYYYICRLKWVIISERSLMDFAAWVLGGLNINTNITRSLIYRIILILILKFKPIYITAYVSDLIKRKPYEKDLIVRLLPYYELLGRTLNLITINTSECSLECCIKYIHFLLVKHGIFL